MIARFFQSLKQQMAAWLGRLAVRLGRLLPQTGPPPVTPPPGGQAPGLDNLPPFTGTPEEAYLLWNSPPVALLRKKQLIRVQPDGSIPEAAEFLKLTALGKVLARVDLVFCDDFGVCGPASEVKRVCHSCNRVGFQAIQTCPVCNRATCPICSEPFEVNGQLVHLCKACKKIANWQRDNWALPSSPTGQSPPNPA